MHKLTGDNIKFIDSYLNNSGVKYIDIRMEMTDHIASALEEMDGMFYDNFKKYMIANKSQFISTNRKFTNAAIHTAVHSIGEQMLSRWFLVPLSTMLGGLYFLKPATEVFADYSQITYVTLFLIFIIYYTAVRGNKRNLFSVADKVLFAGWIVIYFGFSIINYIRINEDYKLVIYAFLISFTIAVVSAFNKLIVNYKKQYNG